MSLPNVIGASAAHLQEAYSRVIPGHTEVPGQPWLRAGNPEVAGAPRVRAENLEEDERVPSDKVANQEA